MLPYREVARVQLFAAKRLGSVHHITFRDDSGPIPGKSYFSGKSDTLKESIEKQPTPSRRPATSATSRGQPIRTCCLPRSRSRSISESDREGCTEALRATLRARNSRTEMTAEGGRSGGLGRGGATRATVGSGAQRREHVLEDRGGELTEKLAHV